MAREKIKKLKVQMKAMEASVISSLNECTNIIKRNFDEALIDVLKKFEMALIKKVKKKLGDFSEDLNGKIDTLRDEMDELEAKIGALQNEFRLSDETGNLLEVRLGVLIGQLRKKGIVMDEDSDDPF